MWVTLTHSSLGVTPSPEDLLGCCSISPLLSQTILNLVAAALIFLPFLSLPSRFEIGIRQTTAAELNVFYNLGKLC